MQIEPKKYLFDIQNASEKIERFTQTISVDEYLQDDLLKSGVERQFEIIGEALNQLIKTNPPMKKEFPDAHDIISFRNLLIHGYSDIDDHLVWDIVKTRLPKLIEKVNILLNQ